MVGLLSQDYLLLPSADTSVAGVIDGVSSSITSPCPSSAEVEAPWFTSLPPKAAESVSIGIAPPESNMDGDDGLSKLTLDSLLLGRITNGCSLRHMSTSC